jgi:hypothetical protein
MQGSMQRRTIQRKRFRGRVFIIRNALVLCRNGENELFLNVHASRKEVIIQIQDFIENLYFVTIKVYVSVSSYVGNTRLAH